jgi:iron-sulfur cluster repair protein YtfE (RIC family)
MPTMTDNAAVSDNTAMSDNTAINAATASAAPRPNTRDMVVIHRVFRREFPRIAHLIEAAPARDLARARDIAAHLDFVLAELAHHHEGEDEYLWPKLSARAEMEAELIHRMRAQHAAVAAADQRVRSLLARWRDTAAQPVARELAEALRELSSLLGRHLDEEEADVLPLVAEYITVAEWTQLGESILAKFPRSALNTMLGQVLDVATEADRALFFGKLPAVARLAWRVSGRRRYAQYTRRIQGEAVR